MKFPPHLKKDDKVGIVCTARAIDFEKIMPSINLLQDWGLKTQIGSSIGKRLHQFGGSDKDRQTDLQQMLDNPAIKAIFCAKGGYGTARILDGLNLDVFEKKPKWIIGFSDVTALHCHLQNQTQIASLHAPLLSTLSKSTPSTKEALQHTLFGHPQPYNVEAHPLNRLGKTKGILLGGNLSVIYSILGSNSDLTTQGCILFLEDLDEYLYHIDRMVLNLKRAGKLNQIVGLIVGGMTKMKDNDIPFGWNGEEIIAQHVEMYDFPVCFGFPAGHLSENFPLILGGKYKLNVGKNNVKLQLV